MELKTNKEFFEQTSKILEKLYARVCMILDDYEEYLVNREPNSFDTYTLFGLLSSVKNEYIDVFNEMKELEACNEKRFEYFLNCLRNENVQ